MSASVDIPREVDSQLQVLWWEIDELFIAMIVFGSGLMTHHIVIPVIVALVVMHYIAKMKSEALPGAGLHFLYWFGFSSINKEFNDSMERKFYL